MKAYHFLKSDMTSNKGNEPAWEVGEEREIKGDLIMCEHGYHSSPSWYDAIRYALGHMACIVEISGETIKDGSKQVSRKRKLVDVRDASRTLRVYLCDCMKRSLRKTDTAGKPYREFSELAGLYIDSKATIRNLSFARIAANKDDVRATRNVNEIKAEIDTETRWKKRRLDNLMKELFKGEQND